MTTQKDKALEAYFNAQAQESPDWRAIAEQFFSLHKPRKTKTRKRPVKGRYPFPVFTAEFADGEIVEMTVYSPAGKPLDWGRAVRICQAGYRNRLGMGLKAFYHPEEYPTPPISLMCEEITGEFRQLLAIAAE